MSRKIRKAGITRRGLIGAAGAGAVLAASPFRINLARAQEATIKIGFPVPLTGPYGAEAQDQVNAAQLAIAEFNEAGGLNGRKAELLVRDDKLNPGEAATRALELIEQEKVNFICRQPVGGRAARGEQRHQGTRRHLQFDQPVRHHQRGVGLQQIHLPRGAQSASDGGRGRPLCVPQIRQEGRLPHRRLCLWP